jgi:predicted MPP superfamily phosphohydrolase
MDLKRRTFLKYAGATALGATGIVEGALLYGTTVEPDWLEVVTIPIHLPRLDPVFRGYRIVQLSDIHADTTWMDVQRLASIVQVANSLRPDLVLITGDFITYVHVRMHETLSALKALQAPDGIFAVLGNRDYLDDPTELRSLLPAYRIQELKNRTHTLYRNGAMLHLVGMDDLWEQTDHYHLPMLSLKGVLTSLLQSLPTSGPTILLAHEPDFADVAATTGRIDLQLSGHTHGGQVRIPGHGAITLPNGGKKYQIGLYHVNTMIHYTSRGLGMITPQIRINCRPEITVFICNE